MPVRPWRPAQGQLGRTLAYLCLFRTLLLLITCSVLLVVGVRSAHALEVPPLVARVMDQADLIDRERERQLEAKLRAHEQATQHQLAVLTIASLEGEPIEDYSMRVAESWKLGHAKEDNGLLLLVVAKEKKVRIEVGYGLEGEVPDVIAGRIIRNVIVPRFGQGNFAGGIEEAMQLLMNASAGKQVEIDGGGASFEPGFSNAWPLLVFLLLFLVLPAFGARRGRSGMLFWGGLGQSGFGGRSGGGGFSGGGGGFGGGGASGGW